uniref:Uncharacterized protein n=1 Tax=Glossina pallidipes TaxID=7398 RepID=A0A1B0AGL8_GLOPL
MAAQKLRLLQAPIMNCRMTARSDSWRGGHQFTSSIADTGHNLGTFSVVITAVTVAAAAAAAAVAADDGGGGGGIKKSRACFRLTTLQGKLVSKDDLIKDYEITFFRGYFKDSGRQLSSVNIRSITEGLMRIVRS